MNRKTTITIAVLFLGIAVAAGLLWQILQSRRQAEIDAAYRAFLPEGPWSISNRYYEKQLVFTDGVERFRFDGAKPALVDRLVEEYELTRAAKLASSSFKAPRWWQLPEGGVCYIRGSGNQYFMLVFDREDGRLFFETTQD